MNQIRTKERIIAASLEMFNDLGVEKTTTRHIANRLDISQGNLHYHYANKDKIIEQLFRDLMDQLNDARKYSGQAMEAEPLLQSMMSNFEIMHAYRLFFQQNDVVWRRIPSIKEEMLQLFESKQEELIQLIRAFKNEKRLRPEVDSLQMETLAEQLIFTIQSWVVVDHYWAREQSHTYYARYLFRLWLPYLEDEELAKWRKTLGL